MAFQQVRRGALATLAAAALLAALRADLPAAHAQTGAGPGPLRIDVVVNGLDGAPIRGLTRDDFDVLVRGERRPVEAFREVIREPGDPAISALPADLRSEVATNTLTRAGRLIVFVLDDRSVPASREAAIEMLDAIDPDVPVGLAFAGGAPGVELTLDRARLRAALDAAPGSLPDEVGAGSPWPGLAEASAALADRERRRRAFVVVGGGPRHALDDAARAALEAAARDAGVAWYAWTDGDDADAVDTAVAGLARQTGGRILSGLTPASAIAVVLADFDQHYLISLAARPGDEDVDLDDVAVHVRRERAVVRPRLGHGDGPVPADAPGEDDTRRWDAGLVPQGGAELRASATAFPDGGRETAVAVALEMSVPRAPLEALDPLLADQVDWRIEAVNLATGRIVSRRRTDDAVALRPRATDASRHDVVQYEFLSWLDLPPGPHQLRVTASSRTLSTGGSVFLSVDVPRLDSAIGISGLVFGYPAGTDDARDRVEGVVLDSDLRGRMGGSASALSVQRAASAPRIPVRPAFDRAFDRWEELRLFFEVARSGGNDGLAAEVEVTDVLGRVVHSGRPVVGRRDRTPVTLDLPLATFVPGLYRVSVSLADAGVTASREAAFVVSGVPPSPEELAALIPVNAAEAPPTPPATVEPAAPPATPPPGEPPAVDQPVRLRPDLSPADRLRARGEADKLAVEGWERYQQGDVEGARERLARSVALGNDSGQAHYALGLAEYALGHYEPAVSAFEFARRRRPDHEPVYFDLTDAYLSLDRTGDALAVLRDAAARWPDDPEVHNAMGVVHFARRELDEAIGAFEGAVRVAPRDGLGHFNLASAYRARMMRWQAERGVQTLTATRALADRDRQQAIAAYTKALELGGSFEWDAREALRLLSGGGVTAASR